MREILFRGKTNPKCDGICSIWVYGNYFKMIELETAKYVDAIQLYREDPYYEDPYLKIAVKPETIGQYTGLTDKNGKKIFEGDIIYSAVDLDGDGVLSEELLTVYFDKNLASFLLKSNQSEIPCEIEDYVGMTVTGNIHDNPELLEEV